MSSLTNYWRVVKPQPVKASYVAQDTYTANDSSASFQSFSWYTQLMQGSSTRIQEYGQFEAMDKDVYVYRALDTIAEEMSNIDEVTRLPFEINYNNDDNKEVSENVVMTVKAALRHWVDIQDLKNRIFRISRMTVKNGDCFFRKVKEHKKWQYVPTSEVTGIEVDEFGDVVSYHMRSVVRNQLSAQNEEVLEIVPASAVVHFTLSDSMGPTAPFGESILKPVTRTFKQMGLLEDAIIIYRVVRAPERRVFYIDVGNMPPQKVKTYLESVKTELKQKRVPVQSDHGDDMDSVYNPTSMSEDYFLGTTANGRGSRIETLPGGTSLGENDDLKYFQQKLFLGLRVPTSYMRGSADGGAQYNDGKVGIAYIEELRFSNFVQRLQSKIERVFDAEFKAYLANSGIKVDDALFNITLPVPQNFDVYRQTALNAELFNTFQNADQIKYLSKRYILKTFLHFSEDAIQTNEAQLRQERGIAEDDEHSLQKFYNPAYYENIEPVKFGEDGEEVGPEGDEGMDGLGGDSDMGDMGDMGGLDIGDEPVSKPPRPDAPASKPARPDSGAAEKPARPNTADLGPI
jgi:hypothetical protein